HSSHLPGLLHLERRLRHWVLPAVGTRPVYLQWQPLGRLLRRRTGTRNGEYMAERHVLQNRRCMGDGHRQGCLHKPDAALSLNWQLGEAPSSPFLFFCPRDCWAGNSVPGHYCCCGCPCCLSILSNSARTDPSTAFNNFSSCFDASSLAICVLTASKGLTCFETSLYTKNPAA